jgi:ABC-2 type transport system permease protein
MLRYLRLEILRMFRDRRFVFFTIGFPVALYLLMSNVFGSGGADEVTGLPARAYLMVGFASYGAIGAVLSTTGPRLAVEIQSGWLRQLQVTPLPARSLIIAKMLAAMTLALPALTLVSLAAAVTRGVHLSAGAWVGMIALMWVGTLPFAALGTLIGSAVNPDSAQPVMLVCYLGLSIAGGLWIPVGQLPEVLRSIATWLPSNRFAELGWDIAGGQLPSAAAGLVLAAWTVALGGLAAAAYRRATVNA